VIVYLPSALFVAGGLLAYGSAGLRRQLATLVMVGAAGWALALLVNPGAASWAIGSLLATILLPRPAKRVPSTFEVLSRRALTLGGLVLLALLLASQLPVGENPLLLNVVPWLLGAVGSAWLLSPIDPRERTQGQVLMVGATGALVLVALPGGSVTAAAAGVMALMPVLGQIGIPARPAMLLSSLTLALAALAAGLALTGIAIARLVVGDLVFGFAGAVLLGVALVLAAAALGSPTGIAWVGLLAALALIATAPAVRLAALAALVALATRDDHAGERPAWMAVAALAAVPVLQGLASPLWSARVQTVALGAGLVLMAYAARSGLLRTLVLPTAGFQALLLVPSLSSGNVTRLQWIAAAGALLLVGRALLVRREPRSQASLRGALIRGLLLLSIAARDALGLGALATALLLIELALLRRDEAGQGRSWLVSRALALARSNWPPSITFAGGTLAVIAALQASLALGLLAAAMLAGLQLAPLLDRSVKIAPDKKFALRWRTVGPAITLACGVVPALVLRMLRL
jgi:hypothetical protein